MKIGFGQMKGILTEKNLGLIKELVLNKQISQHLDTKRKRE